MNTKRWIHGIYLRGCQNWSCQSFNLSLYGINHWIVQSVSQCSTILKPKRFYASFVRQNHILVLVHKQNNLISYSKSCQTKNEFLSLQLRFWFYTLTLQPQDRKQPIVTSSQMNTPLIWAGKKMALYGQAVIGSCYFSHALHCWVYWVKFAHVKCQMWKFEQMSSHHYEGITGGEGFCMSVSSVLSWGKTRMLVCAYKQFPSCSWPKTYQQHFFSLRSQTGPCNDQRHVRLGNGRNNMPDTFLVTAHKRNSC